MIPDKFGFDPLSCHFSRKSKRRSFLTPNSPKHHEGFFRWVHLSCSHESQHKVSVQGIIIMKVIARSRCKQSLQGVIVARSDCCKESLQGVIARSHENHCKLQGAKHIESSASCKCMELSASCKCKEPSASCKCVESSASCMRKEPWQVASARSQVQVASARSQVQLTCEELKSVLRARGSADDTLRKSTLCGDRRGRGAKTRGFFAILFWPARPSAGTGVVNSMFSVARATLCAEQVAQTSLRRATCADQFAQSTLPRATYAEQLAQSNLHRAACAEQLAESNLHGVICTEQLAGSHLQGATCAEQLAQSNLHRATCADQLARTSLRSTLPRATRSFRRATCTCARPGLNKFAAHVPGQEKRAPPAALGRPRLRCYAFGPTVV